MPTNIHLNAVIELQYMKNPSFIIFEFQSNAIVDFAEDLEEAEGKCKIADSVDCKCKYFEMSLDSIEKIREFTKNVDLAHPQRGLTIPNLDMHFSPN